MSKDELLDKYKDIIIAQIQNILKEQIIHPEDTITIRTTNGKEYKLTYDEIKKLTLSKKEARIYSDPGII